MSFDEKKREALSKITNPHDGPVTRFVMVARAIRLARQTGTTTVGADPIAEALDEALEQEWPHSGA